MSLFEDIYEISGSEWKKVQDRFKELSENNRKLENQLKMKNETEKLLLQKIHSLECEMKYSQRHTRIDSSFLDKHI